MRIPDGWERFKTGEGKLPVSKTHRVRYYTPETGSGRSIWITKLRNNTYRLHHHHGREKYDTLKEAETAAIKWMQKHPQQTNNQK